MIKDLVIQAKNFPYHCFEYIELEELRPLLIIDEKEYLLFVQPEKHRLNLYWGADSSRAVGEGLTKVITHPVIQAEKPKPLYIEFVPCEFMAVFEEAGFVIDSEFCDYWLTNLPQIHFAEPDNKIRRMEENEYSQVGAITRKCREFSRGFHGETDEYVKEWFNTENSQILIAEVDDKVVGACFMNLYGFDSLNGPIAWLRELAVDPDYQSKGIGRALAITGLKWGQEMQAQKSFLSCDVENYRASRLYETLGYQKKAGRGQINMLKTW